MKVKIECDKSFEVELKDDQDLSQKVSILNEVHHLCWKDLDLSIWGTEKEKEILMNSIEGLDLSIKISTLTSKCSSEFVRLIEMITAAELLTEKQRELIKNEL